MRSINVLDCTLRDGGYINNWRFGKNNIQNIIDNLIKSSVEYIEVGYYSDCKESNEDRTIFSNLNRVNEIIDSSSKFLVMINYSEVDINNIPNAIEVPNIFGIRLAFHKKDQEEAIKYCYQLKEKGYKVFVQPMVTMAYKELELTELINEVNKLNPYAFYFVDSFGFMMENDVVSKFSFVGKLLNNNILLGFHSHNNLQLSYANTLSLINLDIEQNIILDSSVYGMGRGAGNLNTELIIGYLNSNCNKNYKVEPLLKIVDNYLQKEKQENNWGYSIEYFLSAIMRCHPNYSKAFMNHDIKKEELLNLLSLIVDNKKIYFDKEYADNLYKDYTKEKTIRK